MASLSFGSFFYLFIFSMFECQVMMMSVYSTPACQFFCRAKPPEWKMFCALSQPLPISAQAGGHCAFVEVQRFCVCVFQWSSTLLLQYPANNVLLGGEKQLNKKNK